MPGDDALQFFNDRYSVDAPVMASVLSTALAQGGDFAELFFEHRTSSSIGWQDQHVTSAQRNVAQGVGIRVVKGDAIGYAYTESLEPEAMMNAARTAGQIGSDQDHPQPIDATPGALKSQYYTTEQGLTGDPADAKVELLRRADAAARAEDDSVARVDASINDELKRIVVARSDGRIVSDTQPMVVISVGVLSQRGEKRQTSRNSGGGRMGMDYFERVTPEDTAREAVRQAVRLHSAVDAPAGTLPVVMAAGDSGILLHEAIGHGLEADFNRKGTSNYADRIGESVAHPQVTVVDDGTITDSRGSINIDDEGNETGRNVLIENGILKAYLQDEISARHFKVGASGSGRRQSFKHPIMPRMTNTIMLAGEENADDIIRSVKRGIYCVSFAGGQVNISNGDFVFSTTDAFMIEDGKITAPIKTVNLIGNGPDTLSKISMVGSDYKLSDGRWTCGKDGQSVPVGVGLPTVLVSGMTVGGTDVG